MAKVHISLVGGQPTPVYQGVLLSQPDRIILICSGTTKNNAESIRKRLNDLQYFNVLIEVLPVENAAVIKERIEFILSNYVGEQDSLTMNLSSGVKIWSLLLLQLCGHTDAHIYCLSQNGEVLTVRGSAPFDKVDFDMFTQFKLLDHPLERYTCFVDYGDNEKQNAKTLKQLYKNSTFQKLKKALLLQVQQQYAGNNKAFARIDQTIDFENNQYIKWHAMDEVFSISLNDKLYYEVLGDHAVDMLLNTAWFEYEVASMMAEIYGAHNVYTNCRFLTADGTDKNEVDVIVNTGQKLLFVECKTAISKITDIDKFASVVRNYGGNGSKALFVTLDDMNSVQKEKCRDNHIEAIHLQTSVVQLKNYIQSILTIPNV
ncbi:MAG: DUF1887 family protein [Paludibacteraceae bacterium]|nr:DUF1887 family protein [Paludibacteraceae bacterium]